MYVVITDGGLYKSDSKFKFIDVSKFLSDKFVVLGDSNIFIDDSVLNFIKSEVSSLEDFKLITLEDYNRIMFFDDFISTFNDMILNKNSIFYTKVLIDDDVGHRPLNLSEHDFIFSLKYLFHLKYSLSDFEIQFHSFKSKILLNLNLFKIHLSDINPDLVEVLKTEISFVKSFNHTPNFLLELIILKFNLVYGKSIANK